MVQALKTIKATMTIACITNNVKNEDMPTATKGSRFAEVMDLFDTVIESSKVGVRKPEPAIYHMACEAIGIAPNEAVFLDDLGINLKPARALGMTTIKVVDPDEALRELSGHLGIALP